MATITDILDGDLISASNEVINNNFDNLNTDKIETSYLDTDTAMAANSDVKIPSQKAVKTYIDTSGGSNASETVRGIVEEATDAEVTAGTATGATGAKLVVTPAKLATRLGTISIATTQLTGTVALSNLPTPAFYQRISITPLTTAGSLYASAANSDGSVLFLFQSSGNELFRYAKDSNTGMYYQTHRVNTTPTGPYSSMVIVGSYLYIFCDLDPFTCYRYDSATGANETLMTIPSIDVAGNNYDSSCWTDGTYIYVVVAKANTTAYKLSISGTTLTQVTTSTCNVTVSGNTKSFIYDGTNTYEVVISSSTITIRKATDIYFVASTTTTYTAGTESGSFAGSISIPLDANRMYAGYWDSAYDPSAQIKVIMSLTPYTKP